MVAAMVTWVSQSSQSGLAQHIERGVVSLLKSGFLLSAVKEWLDSTLISRDYIEVLSNAG